MKKQGTRQHESKERLKPQYGRQRSAQAGEAPDTGHLDDTLTRFVRASAQGVKKWRVPLAAAIIAGVAVAIAVSIWAQVGESKKSALSRRIYLLFESSKASAEGYEPPAAEMEQLLEDARGTPEERLVLKEVGNFYLDRGATIDDEIRRDKDQDATAGGKQAEGEQAAGGSTEEKTARRDAALDKAVQIADDAAARFPEDVDIQKWTAALREKARGIKDTSWLPPARTFRPLPPSAVSPQPEAGTAPAAAQPPPAAEAPAAEKPKPETTTK